METEERQSNFNPLVHARQVLENLAADLVKRANAGGMEEFSRFDALTVIRDQSVSLVNGEREAEKQRVAAARDRLKQQLKAQSDRLRSVSVVTKPRGKRPVAAEAKAS